MVAKGKEKWASRLVRIFSPNSEIQESQRRRTERESNEGLERERGKWFSKKRKVCGAGVGRVSRERKKKITHRAWGGDKAQRETSALLV